MEQLRKGKDCPLQERLVSSRWAPELDLHREGRSILWAGRRVAMTGPKPVNSGGEGT